MNILYEMNLSLSFFLICIFSLENIDGFRFVVTMLNIFINTVTMDYLVPDIKHNNKSFLQLSLHTVGALMFADFLIYCYHYLLHNSPFLYKWIHKVHHSVDEKTMDMVDSWYMHPIETIIVATSNAFSINTIISPSRELKCALIVVSTIQGIISHSKFFKQYNLISVTHHFEHHKFVNRNYKVIYIEKYILFFIRNIYAMILSNISKLIPDKLEETNGTKITNYSAMSTDTSKSE